MNSGKEGVALIVALALLALFALLGTAYVSFMTIEYDAARYEVLDVRARTYAEAGITAVVGELRSAVNQDLLPKTNYTITLSELRHDGSMDSITIEVSVEDELRLLNANHLPREVLEALDLERSAIRGFKTTLPRSDSSGDSGRSWMASAEELPGRLGLDAGQELINSAEFTVYGVADQQNPAAYLNLNSMNPKALAAILNLTADEAESLAAQRPFASWSDVVAKSKKEPSSYNVHAADFGSEAMPEILTLQSRCFRLKSTVRLRPNASGQRTLSKGVEAVVLIHEDGTYSMPYWSHIKSDEKIDVAAEVVDVPPTVEAETSEQEASQP